MAAISTKDLKICMSGAPSLGAAIVPTAITKANPAVVTVAAIGAIVEGNVIKIKSGGTGFDELDNKAWIVGSVTGNTFTLLGSDTTASTGTLAGTPSMLHFEESDMTCMCFSEFTVNSNTAPTLNISTYCDPNASTTSFVYEAGTISCKGHVDISDTSYKFMVDAADDGLERIIRVVLPSNRYLVVPVTFAGLNWEFPIGGIQAFSTTMTMATKMRHLF